MIQNVEDFVKYLDGISKRTNQYVDEVPESILDWKPADEKFTTGELLRHIASSRLMFLNIFENGEWIYSGHDVSKGESLAEIKQYLETCHTKLTNGLLSLGDELLKKKVPTLHGHEVSAWRIMMALVEHEIHHRGQLSTYLQINESQPPQVFGLKIEDVKKV